MKADKTTWAGRALTVATHLRACESPAGSVVVGIIVWSDLYLREPRLRALVPFRRRNP